MFEISSFLRLKAHAPRGFAHEEQKEQQESLLLLVPHLISLKERDCTFRYEAFDKSIFSTNFHIFTFIFFFLFLTTGLCSSKSDQVGILVMAHGGDAEWNAAVEKAVNPLRSSCPVVVAFGMADRDSLQAAIDRLEGEGVYQIAVVRLFVSTYSFAHQTEYFLGIRSDPSPTFVQHHTGHEEQNYKNTNSYDDKTSGRNQTPTQVRKNSFIILNQEGLYDSPIIGAIIAERVRAQSVSSQKESLLILGHGTENSSEDSHWLSRISELANKALDLKQFRSVRVETLREDWNELRRDAEQRIRDFVSSENRRGARVIVIPFRVFGFGPYREVLKDLQYVANGVGLLPHPNVTEWIKSQAIDCFARADWKNPFEERKDD